jgi:hypothetical protein
MRDHHLARAYALNLIAKPCVACLSCHSLLLPLFDSGVLIVNVGRHVESSAARVAVWVFEHLCGNCLEDVFRVWRWWNVAKWFFRVGSVGILGGR